MKNWFLRWYLRRLLSAPILRAVSWTPAERDAFDLFCRSSCGIKLFEFLRQCVATQTFNAVCRDSASANARARGAQEILALLHRLRVFPLEESAQTEASEILEQAELPGQNVSDRQRWVGGSGAIG